ncbi:hypothetical protein RBLE17_18160 [Rhodobacteraceae bacterium LE17]|nr:hypothetical protein [Rhodobacteraceae bacterium LE17]
MCMRVNQIPMDDKYLTFESLFIECKDVFTDTIDQHFHISDKVYL